MGFLKSHPYLLVGAKTLISAGLVWWIVRDLDFTELGATLARANIPLLVSAFALYFLGYVITAVRWRLLMSIHGYRPPLFVLVQSFMVAIFFNNLLPSTIGGDASRMFDAWRLGGSKTHAVSVVLVDRFMGILALLCWALLAVVLTPQIRALAELTVPLSILSVGAVATACLVYGWPLWLVRFAHRVVSSLPGLARSAADKILSALGAYYGHRPVLGRALTASLLLQLNVIIHFWLIAYAVDIEISFSAMCVIIPCALMLMMLPISINAIGVREAAFVYFMGVFGVAPAQAVIFAWIAFIFVILQGLLGGAVFALRRAPPDLSAGG